MHQENNSTNVDLKYHSTIKTLNIIQENYDIENSIIKNAKFYHTLACSNAFLVYGNLKKSIKFLLLSIRFWNYKGKHLINTVVMAINIITSIPRYLRNFS